MNAKAPEAAILSCLRRCWLQARPGAFLGSIITSFRHGLGRQGFAEAIDAHVKSFPSEFGAFWRGLRPVFDSGKLELKRLF